MLQVFVDDEEVFKKALGGKALSTWWILKPWVIKDVLSFAKKFGSFTGDVTDKKTQMLGGTMVIKNGEVIYVHRETSSFDNGDANDLLAAVLGKASTAVDKTPTSGATCAAGAKEYTAACS